MNYLATLIHMCHIPPGSIYRGNGKFDFSDTRMPDIVRERLKECQDNGTLVYRKPGETTDIYSELKRDSRQTANAPRSLTAAQVLAEKAAKQSAGRGGRP